MNAEIVIHEFQVNKPNGDIDFIEVADLTFCAANTFVKNKYPDCNIEHLKTTDV